jgi:hypothetical protein
MESSLEDCKCGLPAETWVDEDWVLTGCKACGVAAAAYKDSKQSAEDWNAIAKIDREKL